MSGEEARWTFASAEAKAASDEAYAQHEQRRQARHTKTVCQAGREALRKAGEADLPRDERRMFDTILSLTWGWNRLTDDVSLPQLGQLNGMGGSAEYRQKEASRLVRALAGRGLVTYSPGNGRGKLSQIGLPVVIREAPKGGTDDAETTTPFSPPANDKGGENATEAGTPFGARKGVPIERERGYRFTPESVPPPDKGFTERSSSSSAPATPEVAEEEESDSVGEACRLVAERRLAIRTGQPITNRERWLTAVAARARSELDGLDLRGLSAEAIADRIQPRPPTLYDEAGTATPAAPDARRWTVLDP